MKSVDAEKELLVIEAVDTASSNTLVLSENLTTENVTSIVVFSTVEADILALKISSQDIGAAAASHTHVSTGAVSIPASGWKNDNNASYPYYCDLSISGAAASDRVDLNIVSSSIDIAVACGLCPLTEAFSGKVRLRAKKVPTAAISAEYWIMKK